MIKKKGIITTIVAMAMFCMMSISSLAAVEGLRIYLPEGQTWTDKRSVTRTGAYSYVSASLSSVYPVEGSDNFTKIQARLVDEWGNQISESAYAVLTEGKGYEPISIAEGKQDLKTVYIQFRGNKNDAAYAVVNYKGN